MFGLFGVSNTGMVNFVRGLRGVLDDHDWHTFKPSMLSFMSTQEEVEELKGVVMVPSLSQLRKWKAVLMKRPVVVFVFDTAIVLEYVPSITVLDLLEKQQAHRYIYKTLNYEEVVDVIKRAKSLKKRVEFAESEMLLIPQLLESTQPSILSPILNYIYTLRDLNQRHAAQLKLFQWIRKGDPDSTPVLPESKGSKRLLSFLGDSSARNLIKAVGEMMNGGAPDKLAKKHSVAAFDLRYVRSQFTKFGIK